MKKITKTKALVLHTETIKTLTEDKLAVVAGGRWYESWSLCGGGNAYLSDGGGCPNASSGVRG